MFQLIRVLIKRTWNFRTLPSLPLSILLFSFPTSFQPPTPFPDIPSFKYDIWKNAISRVKSALYSVNRSKRPREVQLKSVRRTSNFSDECRVQFEVMTLFCSSRMNTSLWLLNTLLYAQSRRLFVPCLKSVTAMLKYFVDRRCTGSKKGRELSRWLSKTTRFAMFGFPWECVPRGAAINESPTTLSLSLGESREQQR